ncbi:MAG: cytidine deaminase [Kofleriaceae bacterium]|nr:cytidine deaminase [Kofleriaceae bacterium]MCB9575066.1 cytidine deaminase [Kofleriaceae bacterium]
MSAADGRDDDAALVARALAARDLAYAPYSHFLVGVALVADDGTVFDGANVENASYGLSICAERNAVARMVLAGHRAIRAVYVATTTSPPATPCGMCRQTLLEFAPDPAAVRVVAVNPAGERAEWTLAALIPAGFTGAQLG